MTELKIEVRKATAVLVYSDEEARQAEEWYAEDNAYLRDQLPLDLAAMEAAW